MGEESRKNLVALVVEPEGLHQFDPAAIDANVSLELKIIGEAKEALLWLKENKPDFLLVNLVALGDRGLNLAKMVRSSKRFHHLPITVLYKGANDRNYARASSLGIKSLIETTLPEKNILTQAVRDYEAANAKTQKKAQHTQDVMNDLKEKLKNEEIELPSQPKLLFQLINFLNDDNSTIQQISDLVEKEPSICAKIIKAANSVHFAAAKPVVSASDAVMRIGLKRTLNYVLVIEQGQMFETELEPFKKIREQLWQHSVAVGITARYMGQQLHYENVDSLFALGLLHDIGKIALLRLLHELPKSTSMDADVIWPILNKMHTKMGASMLTDWQFPQDIIDVVRYHHDKPVKDKTGQFLLITGLANQTAHMTEKRFGDSEIKRMVRTPHAMMLKYKPDYYKGYKAHLDNEFSMMAELMS